MKKQFQVIVKTSSNNRPRDHELSAALILTEFFQNDIVFLRPIPMKSPDLAIKREKKGRVLVINKRGKYQPPEHLGHFSYKIRKDVKDEE